MYTLCVRFYFYFLRFITACLAHLNLLSNVIFLVWEHLLLQLSAAGPLFLPAVPREDLGIPKSASEEGEPPYLPRGPLSQYCQSEEKSGCHSA